MPAVAKRYAELRLYLGWRRLRRTVIPSSLWVDTLVAPSMPAGNPATCAPPAGLPAGGLYYVIPTGLTMKQVFIV